MNMPAKALSTALVSATATAAFAAGSPGVEHHTHAFLDALAASGGEPLETLSSADARALRAQVLLWPVTNANFEKASYDEFAVLSSVPATRTAIHQAAEELRARLNK
jgi:hypothetical protein